MKDKGRTLTPSALGPVQRVDLSNARAEKNLISVSNVFPLCFDTYLEWSVCLLGKVKCASENRVKTTCLTQTLKLFFVSPFQERKPSTACAGKLSVSLFLLPSVTSSFTSPVVLPAAFAPGLHDPLLRGGLQLHPGQQLCPLLLPHAALHQRAPLDLGHPAVTPKHSGVVLFSPRCPGTNQAASLTSQNVYLGKISVVFFCTENKTFSIDFFFKL